MVMIRPRPGDFIYSDLDILQMLAEIETIRAEGLADGFVTGALTSEGAVDEVNCLKLLTACGNLPVTFHRAFDLTTDAVHSMETIIDLGFSRILTSGQSKNAKTGIEILKVLVQRAQDRIVIMAGCGINDKNVETILRETHIREIHSSASKQVKSKMEVAHETVSLGRAGADDFIWNECDEKVVMAMVSIIKRTVFSYTGPSDPNIKYESNNITSNGVKSNGQTNGIATNGINGTH
jgi:copper homeostasis protein